MKDECNISIKINAGRKGFKHPLVINFSTQLVVLTGLNGSGKTTILREIYYQQRQTTILREIYYQQRQTNPESIFFKTTSYLPRSMSRNDRYYPYRSYSSRHESIIPTVEDVLEDIKESFRKFCQKSSIYGTSDMDLFNMLFNENSEYYQYGVAFLPKITDILLNYTNEALEIINKQFGVPTQTVIDDAICKQLKIENPEIKQIKKKYKDGKVKLEPEDMNKLMKKIDIEQRNMSKIKNQQDLETYIYDLINPFSSIESITDKLTRKIDEDYKMHKKKSKFWEDINKELGKYKENEFPYLLNQPSEYSTYQLNFRRRNHVDKPEYISYNDLSSGQKMIFELICYYFVYNKTSNKSKLKYVLFDEFDANLNPSLAELYLKVIEKEFIDKGIMVILTTHSPSTVVEVSPEMLYELSVKIDGKHYIKCADNESGKKEILQKLAPKFVYNEELGYIGTIAKSTKKFIILLEGKTDVAHFVNARKKLGIEDEFEFVECNGAGGVMHLTKSFKIIPLLKDLLNEKIVLSIFDFDDAGLKEIDNILCKKNTQINKDYCSDISCKVKNSQQLYFKSDNVHIIALTPLSDIRKNKGHWHLKNYKIEHVSC